MRYDSKRSALLYFKKWLQLTKQISKRTFQIEEGSCLTTGALKNVTIFDWVLAELGWGEREEEREGEEED